MSRLPQPRSNGPIRKSQADGKSQGDSSQGRDSTPLTPNLHVYGLEASPHPSESEKPSTRNDLARFRVDFLKRLPDTDWSREIVGKLPGAEFYLKDHSGRYVHASRGILKRLGLSELSEIIKTTELDHTCVDIATAIIEEDRRLVETGTALPARFEIEWNPPVGLVWVESSKLPLRDAGGVPIGLICVQREHCAIDKDGGQLLAPPIEDERVMSAANLLFHSRERQPTNGDLAEACGVSKRQLSRLFARYFYCTPARFGTILRIRCACKKLAETDEPISFIAYDCGFSDQSAFTNRFRCITGTTPANFRRMWRNRSRT